jgi:hypothetical protein
MAVNPLSFKFKALWAFLCEQMDRTKVTLRDIEQHAPGDHDRLWQRIRAAEAAYKEDKAHDMDTHLGYARKHFFHGVNTVNKNRKKGIHYG